MRDQDEEELRSEMDSGAADIAEVVSDVREHQVNLRAVDAPDVAAWITFQ